MVQRPEVSTSVRVGVGVSSDLGLWSLPSLLPALSCFPMAEFVDRLLSAESRPRRHLPSPALARASSQLKSHSHFTSFDIDELGTPLLISSSPSAPVVSSTSLNSGGSSSGNGIANTSGRRLPVPGKLQSCKSLDPNYSTSRFLSRSKERIDGHVESQSPSPGSIDTYNLNMSPSPVYPADNFKAVNSRMCESPKLSSRKLPVPPVSAIAINSVRRLLPRPLSCDVPSEADCLFVNNHHFIPRPLSFDYTEDSEIVKMAESSGTVRRPGSSGFQLLHGGSDPTLQENLRPASSSASISSSLSSHQTHHFGQLTTGSCPTLVRPYVSPRSPKMWSLVDSCCSSPPPLSMCVKSAPSSSHHLDAFLADNLISSTAAPVNVPLLNPLTALSLPSRSPFRSHDSCNSGSSANTTPSGLSTVLGFSGSGAPATVAALKASASASRLSHIQRQTSLPPASLASLTGRRSRYQDGGSVSTSIQESCSTQYSRDMRDQRPSRSRLAVRQTPLATR